MTRNLAVLLCAVLLSYVAMTRLRANGNSLQEYIQQLPVSVGDNHTTRMQPGETWVELGIREHVGYEQLRRANPEGMRPGRAIVIAGRHIASGLVADGLVLNEPELMVYRWEKGKVAAWYPVSVGMVAPRWHTPVGVWHVEVRIIDPIWRRPAWVGEGTVPPGPDNPLGDRWIGLSVPEVGFHGTTSPTGASACFRRISTRCSSTPG